ncbi:MAG: LysM peptidoglycan-binding domain-containing protein [Chloroflexi bacterium]|nr:LysM peptidoglycan-binding domain-containing protein [Chloroflexota bacterium]
MHLIRSRWLSLRLGLAVAMLAGVTLIAAGCGGDDDDVEEPSETTTETTPIPTATPYASVPAPTIVATATPQATTDTGQTTASGDEVEYEVEPGDTLSAIAAKFDTTIDAIMELNDIEDAALIFVGQVLTIRPGHVPEGSDTAGSGADATDDGDDAGDSGGETTTDESGAQIYVVQAGDTAYGIALQFEVTLEELAAANGTTVDGLSNLFVGEELIIP